MRGIHVEQEAVGHAQRSRSGRATALQVEDRERGPAVPVHAALPRCNVARRAVGLDCEAAQRVARDFLTARLDLAPRDRGVAVGVEAHRVLEIAQRHVQPAVNRVALQ